MCSEFLVVDYDPPPEPTAESDARRDAEEAAILLAEPPAPVEDDVGVSSGDGSSSALAVNGEGTQNQGESSNSVTGAAEASADVGTPPAPGEKEKTAEEKEEEELEAPFVVPPRKWGIALSFGGFGVEEE